MRRIALITASALAALLGCGSDEGGSGPTEDEIARAKSEAESAINELQQRLSSRLTKALSEGEPDQAVDLCATVAQEVTTEVAAGKGVILRRAALRYRNPANSPSVYEREFMERVQELLASGDPTAQETAHAPEGTVARTDDGGHEYRFLRPIFMKEACTLCHGTDDRVAPATREAIARHYPDDRATGFAVGDFRGVFSVRVPLKK